MAAAAAQPWRRYPQRRHPGQIELGALVFLVGLAARYARSTFDTRAFLMGRPAATGHFLPCRSAAAVPTLHSTPLRSSSGDYRTFFLIASGVSGALLTNPSFISDFQTNGKRWQRERVMRRKQRANRQRQEFDGGVLRRAATRDAATSGVLRTAKAAFLSASNQPLLLSPNGLRTVRLQVDEVGLILRQEDAPPFGEVSSGSALTSDKGIVILPRSQLGVKNVREVFWLNDKILLLTVHDGAEKNYFGITVDLDAEKAGKVPIPSQDASLFVPLGIDERPATRLDPERGTVEVLLGFRQRLEPTIWVWFAPAIPDLVSASDDPELPTEQWREVLVSVAGAPEAVLLLNGTVMRWSPDGWLDLGVNELLAAEGPNLLNDVESVLYRKYLVGLAPDYSVFMIDEVGPASLPPLIFPPLEDIEFGEASNSRPDSSTDLASWIRNECQQIQIATIMHLGGNGRTPRPLFAHPFADVSASDIWLDPSTGYPAGVTVTDIWSKAYAFTTSGDTSVTDPLQMLLVGEGGASTMAATIGYLKELLPETVELGGAKLPGASLAPIGVNRYGDRWLASFAVPNLEQAMVLPVLAEEDRPVWMGSTALPALGGALSPEALQVGPRVEGHRLKGGTTVYLVVPTASEPAALVVLLHDEGKRDRSGATGFDAWLVSRGYAVLKVNFRGSVGFGRVRAEAASTPLLDANQKEGASAIILEDVRAAVKWALDERKVVTFRSSVASSPPVAIMGSYAGADAVLDAINLHADMFACGVAIAPRRPLPQLQGAGDGPRLLVVEFERDGVASAGDLLEQVAPEGIRPEDWPRRLTMVKYAGEGRGGGSVRTSLLDQYRRIDTFFKHSLTPLLGDGAKLHAERFKDEWPFLASALLPSATAAVSDAAFGHERSLEDALKKIQGKVAAAGLPDLTEAAPRKGKRGFTSKRRRKAVLIPKSRIKVQTDGTIEIIVVFDDAPRGLHALLSDVWLHIRAEGAALTVTLPRQPIAGKPLRSYKLPGGRAFAFEVPADPLVGAIENFQAWASNGNVELRSVLSPEDIDSSPEYEHGDAVVVEEQPEGVRTVTAEIVG